MSRHIIFDIANPKICQQSYLYNIVNFMYTYNVSDYLQISS